MRSTLSQSGEPEAIEIQVSGTPRRWPRRAALVLGGVGLCIYVAVLLVTTYLAQQRLIESSRQRLDLELALRASALSYFYAERRNDIANLRRDRVVAAYFANRDLGMSMEYGLRSSLLAVRQAALGLIGERRIGSDPIYTRVVLLDADGSVLVDTAGIGKVDLARPGFGVADGAVESPDVRVLAEPQRNFDEVMIQASVLIKGRVRGALMAWVDQRLALETLLGLSPRGAGTGRYLLRRAGEPPADDSGRAATRPVLVDGTPFELVDESPAAQEASILTSGGFLMGLVLIALILLAGGALLLRFHAQNLVLHTRMDQARQQRLQLARHNARLRREIRRREESEGRLMYQSSYDALTGLPNRALALDRLDQALRRAGHSGRGLLVLYLDLDRFKHVNDSLGHAAGDALLVQVAEGASTLISDADTLARLAADEFLFIYSDLSCSGDADNRAQRILRLFDAPFIIEGREISLSGCLGSAIGPRDGDTADQLLKHADLAMKQAKAVGQGTHFAYRHELDQRVRESLEIATLLRGAAERDELQLLFQPLVDLRSGRTVAAEALLRWNSPELGPVSPVRFIPVAEDSGLIRKLGGWVLERACRDALTWQSTTPCRVAVNVSCVQLQSPDELMAYVEHALAVSGLPPSLLELEITEGVLLADRDDIAQLLARLDQMGVHLSLDDFGTGYSALSYLRRFPFRVLKIDRSFIAGVPESPEDTELTRVIVAMGQALGLTVLAEGVERQTQVEFLLASGCDLAQGYHFSRPVAHEVFVAHLREGRALCDGVVEEGASAA
jgi:diguanylate cyclase (GGDEF)-like protein